MEVVWVRDQGDSGDAGGEDHRLIAGSGGLTIDAAVSDDLPRVHSSAAPAELAPGCLAHFALPSLFFGSGLFRLQWVSDCV